MGSPVHSTVSLPQPSAGVAVPSCHWMHPRSARNYPEGATGFQQHAIAGLENLGL